MMAVKGAMYIIGGVKKKADSAQKGLERDSKSSFYNDLVCVQLDLSSN